jgi:regulator of protease activity HflC (stomatin/prohibitin superfamily)
MWSELAALALVFGVFIAAQMVVVLPENHVMVIESFGRFRRLLKTPGLNFVIPFFERPYAVSWSFTDAEPGSTKVSGTVIPTCALFFDPNSLRCLSKSGVQVGVDLFVEFQISDAHSAVYTSQNVFALLRKKIIEKLTAAVATQHHSAITTSSLNDAVELESLNRELAPNGLQVRSLAIEQVSLPDEVVASNLKNLSDVELLRVQTEQTLQMAELRKAQQASEQELALQKLNDDRELALARAREKAELASLESETQQLLAQHRLAERQQESEMLKAFPELLALRTAELQASALRNSQVTTLLLGAPSF